LQEHSVEIILQHPDDTFHLFGSNERHLRLMEQELRVTIHARTEIVQIIGEEMACEEARQVIQALLVLVNRGMTIGTPDVVTAITMVKNGEIDKFMALYEEEIIKDSYGKPIRVKTLGQKIYVDSIKNHDVVFGIGPAGTGKTFLAVTLAVTALKRGQVKRIILTRPAVEAGESLGFLPGDLKEKVDPYLRPVYDALYQILGKDQTTRLMEREIIEIAPLAYMRGRTLDDAFVILDEIEAALDEANVDHLADFIKEYSQKSQFIIISHRKGTMEASDVLYGVTMDKDGVSKLLSVRLEDYLESEA